MSHTRRLLCTVLRLSHYQDVDSSCVTVSRGRIHNDTSICRRQSYWWLDTGFRWPYSCFWMFHECSDNNRSREKRIRSPTVWPRMLTLRLDLWAQCEENTKWRKWKLVCVIWTPEDVRNRSVSRWDCKNKLNVDLSDTFCVYEISPLFPRISTPLSLVVYYEEVKWEVNRILIESCDLHRVSVWWKTKSQRWGIYTPRILYTGFRGT
jgi:hypothetical protein